MSYETLKIAEVPAYITLETSRLLMSGAEEEDLQRGSRPVLVQPACSSLPTAPPGAKFSHEPTVVQPPKKEPVHTVPTHCKEPLPFNPVEIVKPPLRTRACQQLLRYPETACDRLLGPIAPELGVTSLEEAVGSNTVLGLWNLHTMQSVTDSTRHQRTRSWFDYSIPALLTAREEIPDLQPSAAADETWSRAVEREATQIPHPYQEGVSQLATVTKSERNKWSSRLPKGISDVNEMISNPELKLTFA